MTTQSTHSKGPWEFDGRKIVSPERYVATVDDWSSQEPVAPQYADIDEKLRQEAQANARLIAAAPTMLEALRRIAGMKCDGDLWHGNEDGENVTNDEEHDALVDALCIAREALREAGQ